MRCRLPNKPVIVVVCLCSIQTRFRWWRFEFTLTVILLNNKLKAAVEEQNDAQSPRQLSMLRCTSWLFPHVTQCMGTDTSWLRERIDPLVRWKSKYTLRTCCADRYVQHYNGVVLNWLTRASLSQRVRHRYKERFVLAEADGHRSATRGCIDREHHATVI